MIQCVPLLLLLTLAPPAASVPIEKEPRHRTTFENEHIRVLDVSIPSGDSTLWHTHKYDNVSIKLTDAQLRIEVQGGDTSVDVVTRGAVTFSRLATPLTHKVTNTGVNSFRTMVVELLVPFHGAVSQIHNTTSGGDDVLIDNDRVRVWRIRLMPGQSISKRRYAYQGVRVVVQGETIDTGATRKVLPGSFEWHAVGMEYSLTNNSSELFEAVEIELK